MNVSFVKKIYTSKQKHTFNIIKIIHLHTISIKKSIPINPKQFIWSVRDNLIILQPK